MGKISGSYESVVRGVSEQAAQNRRSGQHSAQVNMISDPVRGLARRHGSMLQDEQVLPVSNFDKLVRDTETHRVYTFYVGEVEYDLIVRTAADKEGLDDSSFAWCFNKSTGKFIQVELDGDALIDQLISGGVSAFVNIGRYIYLAGNTVVPTINTEDRWNNTNNKRKIAATILVGAYSRKFSITLTQPNGTKVTGEYSTPSSSYGGELDTSDIPVYLPGSSTEVDPEYQKKVNDRVNAYNSAVTAWIGTAAAAITPANIAVKLAESLTAQGVSGVSTSGGTLLVDNPAYASATGSDGGDGSLLRVVGAEVDNVDLVNTFHWVGKVVKVPPATTTGNAVYLRAVAKDGQATGWAPVIWRETAGYLMTPVTAFAMGTVHEGVLNISGSASGLSGMTGLAVPDYKSNSVGDDLSSPIPDFVGRKIDFLGVFQDRLVIGSGATLLFSRPGDYLNWFRKSVVTVADDDPWEGFALGTEDDTIKWSTLYDRNLLLYGKRFQYIVSGRQPFTPKTASIIVSTAFEDAIDAEPRATGNFVIYGKLSGRPGSEVASIHQVQAGAIADSPESYKISQQLDTYLQGVPHEIIPLTAPNMVLLRTRSERNRIFTYSYLDDSQSGRLFDSWSHWEWSDCVGKLVGLSRDSGDVLIYTIKAGTTKNNDSAIWIAAEKLVRDTSLSDYPYLDSLRPLNTYLANADGAYLNPAYGPKEGVAIAIEKAADRQFVGLPIDRYSEFERDYSNYFDRAWVGVDYSTYVTPTNPYAKDRNDQPILTGRMTLQSVKIAVAETGAMQVTVSRLGQTKTVLDFNGRILASPTDLIGKQPIVSTSLPAFIGGEIRDCSYTISARSWLPLTITSIDWVAQLFMNTRRM